MLVGPLPPFLPGAVELSHRFVRASAVGVPFAGEGAVRGTHRGRVGVAWHLQDFPPGSVCESGSGEGGEAGEGAVEHVAGAPPVEAAHGFEGEAGGADVLPHPRPAVARDDPPDQLAADALLPVERYARIGDAHGSRVRLSVLSDGDVRREDGVASSEQLDLPHRVLSRLVGRDLEPAAFPLLRRRA